MVEQAQKHRGESVKHGAILYNEAELLSLPIPANHKFQWEISLVGKWNQLAFGVAWSKLISFSKLKIDLKQYKILCFVVWVQTIESKV